MRAKPLMNLLPPDAQSLGIGAPGTSLRRSQRDVDCRAKIKFLPMTLW